jgi:hypothetical protein
VVQRMKDELSALDLVNPVEGYLQRALPERLRRAEFATRRKQTRSLVARVASLRPAVAAQVMAPINGRRV